jgi:hypothetical protein
MGIRGCPVDVFLGVRLCLAAELRKRYRGLEFLGFWWPEVQWLIKLGEWQRQMDNRFVSHKHSYSLRLSWRLVKQKLKRGPYIMMYVHGRERKLQRYSHSGEAESWRGNREVGPRVTDDRHSW